MDLRRQYSDGVIELVPKCYISPVSPAPLFSSIQEHGKPKLRLDIRRDDFEYLLNVKIPPSSEEEGSGHLQLASHHYTPFHDAIRRMVGVIGENGVASADYLHRDSESWNWYKGKEQDLEKALQEYRYASFSYRSPNYHTLTFLANTDTTKNTGSIHLELLMDYLSPTIISMVYDLIPILTH